MSFSRCPKHKSQLICICLHKTCSLSFKLACQNCLSFQHEDHKQKVIKKSELLSKLNSAQRLNLHKNVEISLFDLHHKISQLRNFRMYILQKEETLIQSQKQIKDCLQQFSTQHSIIKQSVAKLNASKSTKQFDQCLKQFKPFIDIQKINNTLRIGSNKKRANEQTLHQDIVSSLTLINDIREYLLKIIQVLMSQTQEYQIDQMKSTNPNFSIFQDVQIMFKQESECLRREIQKKSEILTKIFPLQDTTANVIHQQISRDDIFSLPQVQQIIAVKDKFHDKLTELHKDYIAISNQKTYFQNKLIEKEEKVNQLLKILDSAQKSITDLSQKQKVQKLQPKTQLGNLKNQCEKMRNEIEGIKSNFSAIRQQLMEEVVNQMQDYQEKSVKIIQAICQNLNCQPQNLQNTISILKDQSVLAQRSVLMQKQLQQQKSKAEKEILLERQNLLNEALKESHQKFQKFIRIFELEKNNIIEEIQKFKQKFYEAESKLRQSQKQQLLLHQTLNATQSQIRALTIKIQQNQQKINQHQNNKMQSQAIVRDHQCKTAQLQRIIDQINQQSKKLGEQFKQAEHQQLRKQKRLMNLINRIQTQQMQLKQADQKAFCLNNIIIQKQTAIDVLRQRVCECQAANTKLSSQLKWQQRQSCSDKNSSNSSQHSSPLKRLMNKSTYVLVNTQTVSDSPIDNYRKQIDQKVLILKKSLKSKEDVIQDLQQLICNLQKQKEAYKTKFYQQEKELYTVKANIQQYQKNNMNLKQKNSQLQNVLAKYKNVMTGMEQHIKSLELDIENLDKQKFSLIVDNDILKKDIIAQQQIIQSLQQQQNNESTQITKSNFIHKSNNWDNQSTPIKNQKPKEKTYSSKKHLNTIGTTEIEISDELGQSIMFQPTFKTSKDLQNYKVRSTISKRKNLAVPNRQQYQAVKRLFLTVNNDVLALQQKLRNSDTIQNLYQKELEKKRVQNKKLKIQLAKSRKKQLLAQTKRVIKNAQKVKTPSVINSYISFQEI